jgi:hypothetical protein
MSDVGWRLRGDEWGKRMMKDDGWGKRMLMGDEW